MSDTPAPPTQQNVTHSPLTPVMPDIDPCDGELPGIVPRGPREVIRREFGELQAVHAVGIRAQDDLLLLC
jgi:hypothetical protein